MYGPSGCGKTLVARALATYMSAIHHKEAEVSSGRSVSFISVQSTSIISKVVGESEQAVATIFKNLRASAPCILFLDQVFHCTKIWSKQRIF